MLKISFLLLIVVLAVYQDLQSYKIRNETILLGFILGVLFAVYHGSYTAFLMYSFGMLLPILLLFPLFLFRMFGAGDIKLLSIIGLFLGPKQGLSIIIIAIIVGGIQAIVLLLKNRNLRERLRYLFHFLQKENTKISEGYYSVSVDGYKNAMHFSIPILIALLYSILSS